MDAVKAASESINDLKAIRYSISGHVALVELARPDVMNAYDNAMLRELQLVWRAFESDPDAYVGILAGEGRAFCAGHDLSHLEEIADEPPSIHYGDIELTKPLIAAIHGPTLGGGASMAMACDMRVAADDLKFGYPQVKSGMMSIGGHNWLPRSTHRGAAMELLLTGELIGAAEAHRLGLVNYVVSRDELLSKANELAAKIARNAPLAVRATKEAVVGASRLSFRDGIALAKGIFARLSLSVDWQEGLQAFREKRPPRFSGS